jgi:hypothetical protein
MTTACVNSQFFSGQGALLLAQRDEADGTPQGFIEVGNVSSLTLGVETTTFEHKESCTGARGVDLEITQETNVSMNFTMESLNRANLALSLFGTSQSVSGVSVTDEQVETFHDKWVQLSHIKVSSVVVGDDAVPTTTYTLGTDYELDADAGAIKTLSTGTIGATQVVFVDYAFATQDEIEAVVSSAPPLRWGRFHGLNTADSDKPFVVDVYKMSMQPLAELALINDELAQMDVEARVLSDAFRVTGSKFFSIKRIP